MNPDTPEDESEADLFRAAVAGVKPLSARHHAPAHPAPSARPLQKEADERAVLAELLAEPEPETLESGDTLVYQGAGVQDSVFRKLRRGQFRIETELDLHGYNRSAAHLAVTRFLAYCQAHRHRCVRIIHGKGNGSPNSGPVIKSHLDGWLRKRKDVIAFCSARPVDGGTGAVYVLLRVPAKSGGG
jgi:DNA-nicking Smr family endonuclease